MCPPDHVPPFRDADDLATVRKFNFAIKIACDELHDDPFNPVARAELVRLINDEAPTADAALRVATSTWPVVVARVSEAVDSSLDRLSSAAIQSSGQDVGNP